MKQVHEYLTRKYGVPSLDDESHVVLSAKYGSAPKWIDVTEKLKVVLHGEVNMFKEGGWMNSVFSDPYPGVVKCLIVTYRDRSGNVISRSYRENAPPLL